MCRIERWSVRVLRERIDSMLYERTAISKKPEETIKNDLARLGKSDEMTPELVFRDPYFLDFLGLKDTFSEKDLESAILAELQRFIIECGTDFAFLARQKRITIDNEDYYMDLLFYHRRLRRLIVIELKIGDFKEEYKAQMEIYLRWLSKNDRHDGEGDPLGLILCAGKKQELVELLKLGKSGIHVAEYLTELPPRELLEKKLLEAIKIARDGDCWRRGSMSKKCPQTSSASVLPRLSGRYRIGYERNRVAGHNIFCRHCRYSPSRTERRLPRRQQRHGRNLLAYRPAYRGTGTARQKPRRLRRVPHRQPFPLLGRNLWKGLFRGESQELQAVLPHFSLTL
jgi:predicted nuclease of restriction endonuclease-like (RecB) superfamily